jgi:hypothetical protein
MTYVVAFGRFWFDFVVGDDWRIAVAIVAALAGTALLSHHGVSAWWLMPIAVVVALAASLRRATRPPAAAGGRATLPGDD